jgi:threonine dehydratase
VAEATPPQYADVLQAAARLRDVADRTPLRSSPRIDAACGATIFFKCESQQRAGAFKFRGAYNALAQLSATERRAGVVAYSSGNHAQAVAMAARMLGIAATIVMPQDAPPFKVAATQSHGARIIRYDRYREDRAAICQALADEHGMVVLPPFDHPHVIAGQGTAALELFEDSGPLDALFVPLGGGGLLAGSLLVAEARQPQCRVYGVEPEAGNDGQLSLRRGEIVHIDTPRTIADGAQTQALGRLTFPIIRRAVTDVLTVADPALVEAMRLLRSALDIRVEPTGCLGIAGLRSMQADLHGRRVGVIISGGNIAAGDFGALVESY